MAEVKSQQAWIPLNPPLGRSKRAREVLLEFVRREMWKLRVSGQFSSNEDVLSYSNKLNLAQPRVPSSYRHILITTCLVINDLFRQGWGLRIRSGGIQVSPPKPLENDLLAEKMRIRQQELLKRDEQLAEESVVRFIRSMERMRPYKGRMISIFSLMREGRDLVGEIKSRLSRTGQRDIAGVIEPYIQFSSHDMRCQYTGFKLNDIWRYFRHTWSNQHKSIPGRTMLLLIRDRAVPLHPVVGIAAIASPIAQMMRRDVWIGWHPETFLDRLRSKPTRRLAAWLVKIIDTAIREVYIEDFAEEGLLTRREMKKPSDLMIQKLRNFGHLKRKEHQRFSQSKQHKHYKDNPRRYAKGYWKDRARTHLFASKRALALAEYLEVRSVLAKSFAKGINVIGLKQLLATGRGLWAIKRVLRKARADRMGIAMADINVCGAIAPYNALLGGKLVSMLAVSPAVVAEYRSRYSCAQSEIASAMAGQPIVRAPRLVFFGTTSLYGGGSSQYNRIKIPCNVLGGDPDFSITYHKIGHSESFGTSHFSERTIGALVELVSKSSEGQRVNSIFGEGASPRLRKVREGLELLRFPPDLLLKHGRRRIIYGIALARNVGDYLLGIDSTPQYLFSRKSVGKSTLAIVRWWERRWLEKRVLSDQVLERVAQHTLVYPVAHGARVVLQPTDSSQGNLFGE